MFLSTLEGREIRGYVHSGQERSGPTNCDGDFGFNLIREKSNR